MDAERLEGRVAGCSSVTTPSTSCQAKLLFPDNAIGQGYCGRDLPPLRLSGKSNSSGWEPRWPGFPFFAGAS
jgi:hypothetical protein